MFNPQDSIPPGSQILLIMKLQQFHQMRVESLRECFSISLLPYQSIEYLSQDISTLYLPYAEKNHQPLVGLLENVKSAVSGDSSRE